MSGAGELLSFLLSSDAAEAIARAARTGPCFAATDCSPC